MHCFIFFLEEKHSFQKIILKKTTATIWKALCKIDLPKHILIYKYLKKKVHTSEKKLKHMASARAFQYIHTGMYVQGDWGRGRALKSILLPTFGSSFVDQEFQKMTTTLPTQAYAYTVHTIRCIYLPIQ